MVINISKGVALRVKQTHGGFDQRKPGSPCASAESDLDLPFSIMSQQSIQEMSDIQHMFISRGQDEQLDHILYL